MRGTAAVLLGVALVASLAAATRPHNPAMRAGDTYFACLPGYSFQVKNAAGARCFKAGTTVTSNIVCPAGTVKTLDFSGNRDICMTPSNGVVVYGCSTGYSPDVRPGPDVCQKETPASIIAPTQQVSI